MEKRKKIAIALALVMSMGIPTYIKKNLYNFLKVHSECELMDTLSDYNKFLDDYAINIKKLELSNFELCIKVMSDIWEEIDGYSKPDKLPVGYYRLAFYNEGKGVCTSFSDDFCARINKINPNMKAKNLIVYLNDDMDTEIKTVNIDRTILSNMESRNEFNKSANHMVSIVNIDKDNKLIVDVTNLMFGCIKDGKILMFNSSNKEVIEYRFNDNYTLSDDSLLTCFTDYINSYSNNSDSYEFLEQQYGYKKQESVYKYIDTLEDYPNNFKKLIKK